MPLVLNERVAQSISSISHLEFMVIIDAVIAAALLLGGGMVAKNKVPDCIDCGDSDDYRYTSEAFIKPISCVDKGFDLPSYLSTRSSPKSPVYMWYEKLPVVGSLAGRGHEFLSIGKGWGESCLLNPNGAGCRPFRNVIFKFKDLEECLQDVKADGSWMKKKSTEMIFKRFKYSNTGRLVTRLVMLVNKFSLDDTDEWDQAAFAAMAKDPSDQERIKQCMNVISQDELKCFPVLLGAPGYSGVSVVEHSEHGHPDRLISHTCQVPPVCSRLAMQNLYQFQALHFRKNYIGAGVDVLIHLSRKKTWVTLQDGTLRNQGCELKHTYMKNGIVCWYFPKCVRFMMEKICQEHEQCCPTPAIHQACKQDLSSPECRVCPLTYN